MVQARGVTVAAKCVTALVMAALLAGGCGGIDELPASPGARVAADVIRVVDGDTIHVDLRGRDVTIRLIGIDTPETVAPEQPVECFGRQASAYVTSRLEGGTVDLEFDIEQIDRFGRTLAYVWIGDELINETLVRQGYAVVTTFPPDVRYVDRFTAAQREARTEGAGLWGACPT